MKAFVIGNYMNANFYLVDELPLPGESVDARAFFQEHGGKSFNLAVGLRRLGFEIDLLMAVGNDSAGDSVLDWLQKEGLSTEMVLRLGSSSGMGVGIIGASGNNLITTHQGANALLNSSHIEAATEKLSSANWLLTSFEATDELILAAFKKARNHGIRTYLNPSPWREIPQELFGLIDILVVNASEAANLFKKPVLENISRENLASTLPSMARDIEWNGELLVVTLAHDGCIALSGDYVETCDAFPIKQLDATGAGDAFGCGLVCELSSGGALRSALIAGSACGAIVASSMGVAVHLPTMPELKLFMSKVTPDNA